MTSEDYGLSRTSILKASWLAGKGALGVESRGRLYRVRAPRAERNDIIVGQ
jgi:hypothetical protein